MLGPAVCLIPPRLVHAPIWNCLAELTTIFIDPAVFQRSLGGPIALARLTEPRPLAAEDLFTWRIASSLRLIFHQQMKPDKAFIDAIGCVLAGCLVAPACEADPHGTAKNLSEERHRLLTDFIHARLAGSLRVRDVAKQVGLGVAHFTAIFKHTTGLSPYEYITQCRVRRAEELIASGEYRIIEAATAVGFYDQSHLNRHFKRLLGCSHQGFPGPSAGDERENYPQTLATSSTSSRPQGISGVGVRTVVYTDKTSETYATELNAHRSVAIRPGCNFVIVAKLRAGNTEPGMSNTPLRHRRTHNILLRLSVRDHPQHRSRKP